MLQNGACAAFYWLFHCATRTIVRSSIATNFWPAPLDTTFTEIFHVVFKTNASVGNHAISTERKFSKEALDQALSYHHRQADRKHRGKFHRNAGWIAGPLNEVRSRKATEIKCLNQADRLLSARKVCLFPLYKWVLYCTACGFSFIQRIIA